MDVSVVLQRVVRLEAEMDKIKFAEACRAAEQRNREGIGMMGETGVHNALKYYFVPYTDSHEVKIGGYIADAVGEDGIFEIQTASFTKLKKKLEAFLMCTRVTLVYPIAVSKRIVRYNGETGEVLSRRKSPKKGTQFNCFNELYAIRDMLLNERLTVCLVLYEAEEYRDVTLERRNTWRRGARMTERIPVELIDEIWLQSPLDYERFIPDGLAAEFTAAEFATAAKIKAPTARKALPVLCSLGLCERFAKSGNSYLYRMMSIGVNEQ